MRLPAITGGFVVACVVAAPAASAHHVVSEYGIARPLPATAVEIDAQAARFDLPAGRGHWRMVAPSLEWAPSPRFSVLLRMPLARIEYEGGRSATGIGDLEVSAKARIYAAPHGGLLLSGGVGAEAPSGDPDAGLGGGHLGVGPFLTASVQPARHLVLVGLAALRLATGLGRHHDDRAGVLSPHAMQELFARFALAVPAARFYASLGGETFTPLDGARTGGVARVEVGWAPTPNWRVATGFDAPAFGRHRYEWRARLGVMRSF